MFKKYAPLKEVMHNDWGGISAYVIGNLLVAVFFLAIAIIFFGWGKYWKNKEATVWIAFCFLFCSISRFGTVACMWYGYYTLVGTMTVFTGLVAAVTTLFYLIPAVLKIMEIKSVYELDKEIKEVKERQTILFNLKRDDEATTGNDLH